MNKLEIGDKIYSIQYGVVTAIIKIDRITDKYAFDSNKNMKFNREYADTITLSGKKEKWDTTLYQKETPELRKKVVVSNYKKNNSRHKI